jgi:TatD DNase family protein
MIDTHSHVFLPQFSNDLVEVERRAQEVGVERVLLPNVDLDTIQSLRNTLTRYTDLYSAMMGLHPCSVDENWEEVLGNIEDEFRKNRKDYIAVGEIGLDLYWDKSTLDWQQQALRIQFQWAIDEDIPVSIHCREAFDPLFDVLEEFRGKGLKGVLHCFTGNKEQAERCLDLGLHLGIGGVVTYKNGGLDKSLPEVPLNKLVLETDAPYLSPVPFRGKRNEPSYLEYIVGRLATIMKIEEEEMKKITTENARKLYSL